MRKGVLCICDIILNHNVISFFLNGLRKYFMTRSEGFAKIELELSVVDIPYPNPKVNENLRNLSRLRNLYANILLQN